MVVVQQNNVAHRQKCPAGKKESPMEETEVAIAVEEVVDTEEAEVDTEEEEAAVEDGFKEVGIKEETLGIRIRRLSGVAGEGIESITKMYPQR